MGYCYKKYGLHIVNIDALLTLVLSKINTSFQSITCKSLQRNASAMLVLM